MKCLQRRFQSPLPLGRPTRRGFSLLELMIAVAITAILVAVLVPAFVHVRGQAGLAKELSRGRQLVAGYSSYAEDNDWRLMPGMLSNDDIDDYDVVDDNGDEVTGEAKQRWLWRMAPYLDFQVAEIIQDEGVIRRIETATPADRQYLLTLVPGMGLNSEFIGGNEDSGAQIDAGLESLLDKKLVIRRMSQAKRPAELLTFASARTNSDTLTDFIGGEYANSINGYFRITPPFYASRDWAESYPDPLTDEPDGQSFLWGNLALRYDGRRAAAAYLDGHVDSITEGESQDMRIWANDATRSNWTITD